MQMALPGASDVFQHGGLLFQYICLNNKRTATDMDTVPENSIHPCTPPPPLYVLGIRNITDYFIPFYTKDSVSNRSVLFEA